MQCSLPWARLTNLAVDVRPFLPHPYPSTRHVKTSDGHWSLISSSSSKKCDCARLTFCSRQLICDSAVVVKPLLGYEGLTDPSCQSWWKERCKKRRSELNVRVSWRWVRAVVLQLRSFTFESDTNNECCTFLTSISVGGGWSDRG